MPEEKAHKDRGRSVYIKTFGCSLNQSDTELMAGLLKDAGYRVRCEDDSVTPKNVSANDLHADVDADLVIINTCTVKNLAEKKFVQTFESWKKRGVKIIVAGCIPQADPAMLEGFLKDVPVIGTRQLSNVVSIVDAAFAGNIIHDISQSVSPRLNLSKMRQNPIVEILPISEGCLGSCSYCKTKHARGNLHSYTREDIIAEFKSALADGCKEFWITSQDNGCYGFDIYRPEKYFLPQLLHDLLSIGGDFKIRLGMCNPNHIIHIKDDLIRIFSHPKMYKFLHMPVQAGSNRILRLMNRQYTVEQFKNLVADFRSAIPDITISTDIIVGFPEETEDDFEQSMQLLRDILPDILNLSRFWLRKGTHAETLAQVHGNISKVRSELMKAEFERLCDISCKKWSDTVQDAFVEDYGKDGALIARTAQYKQVIVPSGSYQKDIMPGMFINVKILRTHKFYLVGEVLKKSTNNNI